MADPVISLVDVLERVQEVDAVLVALEDGLSFIAPGGNVVDCTGVFYAERAGHNGRTVAEKRTNVNSKDLTLRCFGESFHIGMYIYQNLPGWIGQPCSCWIKLQILSINGAQFVVW